MFRKSRLLILSKYVLKIRQALSNGFVRNVSVLAGGTAVAQLLVLLVLPILTRLYTPDDFTVLAVFASILAIISSVSCLRLEIAIPIPECDQKAAVLLVLSLVFSAFFGLLTLIVFLFFSDFIVGLIGQERIRPFLYLIPLGIWLTGTYSAFQYWAIRKKNFISISKTRLSQAVSSSGVQVIFGLLQMTPLGLLLGQLVNSAAGIFSLSRSAWKSDKKVFCRFQKKGTLSILREYDRFPKYSTFEAFSNVAGIQLPIILIAALAVGPEAGFLMLATRVLAVPVGLIGGATSQVYLSKASEEMREGNLGSFTSGVLLGLAKVGIGPLLFLGFIAKPGFSFVFGSEWEYAGELVEWMIPWFVLQFISSPISMVMHIRDKQKRMLQLTVLGLAIRLGFIILAAYIPLFGLSVSYAFGSAVFYFICFFVFSNAAFVGLKDILKIIKASSLIISMWAVFGIGLRIFLEYYLL